MATQEASWSVADRPSALGTLLAEGFGEGLAELPVVGFEAADAGRADFQPTEQRGIDSALAVGQPSGLDGLPALAEPFDLGPEVGLLVEPGPGHPGIASDAVEGDGRPHGVHAAQGGECPLAGLIGPSAAASMTWMELSARGSRGPQAAEPLDAGRSEPAMVDA